MGIILHDLVFQDDVRPSPYCWRVRLALEHKGLAYETAPTGFTGIPAIAGGGHKIVPVLEDLQGDAKRAVADSWAIANYLDDTYPDKPLFGPPGAQGLGQGFALQLHGWILSAVNMSVLKIVVPEIFGRILPQDRAYFRETRERRFGMTLEAFGAGGLAEKVAAARAALEPVRTVVSSQAFLSGTEPYYADYVLAGLLFWMRATTTAQVLAKDDPLLEWFTRILNRYGRIAAESTRVWDGP